MSVSFVINKNEIKRVIYRAEVTITAFAAFIWNKAAVLQKLMVNA